VIENEKGLVERRRCENLFADHSHFPPFPFVPIPLAVARPKDSGLDADWNPARIGALGKPLPTENPLMSTRERWIVYAYTGVRKAV